jgi:hypothetical protein
VVSLFAAAVVLLAAFGAAERRARSPLVDLRLFRRRAFAGSNVAMFAFSFSMVSLLYLVNLYLQNFLLDGYSAVLAGAGLLPIC